MQGMISVASRQLQDSKPVTWLAPYLTARAHVMVVRNSYDAALHVHGAQPGSTPMCKMALDDDGAPDEFGPTVDAWVELPTPGSYTVFAQLLDGATQRLVIARFQLHAL